MNRLYSCLKLVTAAKTCAGSNFWVSESSVSWSSDGPERRWTSFLVSWCAIAFNGRSSDGSGRRWTSFLVCLYRCAVWLVSMLAFMLVSVLRLVDSVSLLCLFLEVSTCVVASALWLKPGSATVLELSFSSCWKFCGTFLGCVGMLSIECLLVAVLPGVNVHVSTFFSLPCMDWFHSRACMFSMSGHVIFSFPCRNCFPRKAGVFFMPGKNSAWLKFLFWRCCHCILPVF